MGGRVHFNNRFAVDQGGSRVIDLADYVLRLLADQGGLNESSFQEIRAHAADKGIDAVAAAIDLGIVAPRQAALAKAGVCEAPFVDLNHYELRLDLASYIPRDEAERLGAFVLFEAGGILTVGMMDPLDLNAVDRLRALLKRDFERVLCEPEQLASLIDRAYVLGVGQDRDATATPESLTTGEEPIVAAVNHMLDEAIDRGASDIHISPDERELVLRLRIDGALQRRQGPGLSAHPAIVQRLKVMAGLDLTQTRRPQDGKFRYTRDGRTTDVRLSLVPTVCGENVVMRLLTCGAAITTFNALGMSHDIIKSLEESLANPHGMILATGPTGSGKTTTLYTALKRLNSPDRNVMTIEDPVEIRMPMIRQIQVNTDIGMTFAGALRSVLRQDPDVVLVGEIRDEETARIAAQAALTGHVVLSTLHTNDAAGAIPRLRDFGCPPFVIGAALLGVIAQRLVRKVCPSCAEATPPNRFEMIRFGLNPDETAGFTAGTGCAACLRTGYKGRLGLYELLTVTDAVRAAIEAAESATSIRQTASAEGMRAMWQDGLDKARTGLTTLAEVSRIVSVFGGTEAGAGIDDASCDSAADLEAAA